VPTTAQKIKEINSERVQLTENPGMVKLPNYGNDAMITWNGSIYLILLG